MRHALPPFVKVDRFVLYMFDPQNPSELLPVAVIEENDTFVDMEGTGFYSAISDGYSILELNYTAHGKMLLWEAEYTANGAQYKLTSNASLINFNKEFKRMKYS